MAKCGLILPTLDLTLLTYIFYWILDSFSFPIPFILFLEGVFIVLVLIDGLGKLYEVAEEEEGGCAGCGLSWFMDGER